MMPAMERITFEDLRGPGATLGAGVSAGFLAGVLIGGVGGRLAMLALRLTSDPSLHGVSTDDGFTIGRVSVETLFLLGVTAGLGMAGGLFYLVVRRWIPSPWRIPLMMLFFALVGGAGIIGPSDVDFTRLSPLSLAVAFFVLIPAAYGAMMPWLAERLLRQDSIPATRALGVDRRLDPTRVREHRGCAGLAGCAWRVGHRPLGTDPCRSLAIARGHVARPRRARRHRGRVRRRPPSRRDRHPRLTGHEG
jgi:hypothetical protein